MSRTQWKESLDPKVYEELERLLLIVSSAVVAERLWERVLTENQRRRLGDSLPQSWERMGTIRIWQHFHNVSQPRAIIEVAQKTGFVDETTARWLLRGVGERASDNGPADRPSWEVETGRLRWRGRTVRKVRVMQDPTNLQRILDAFESAGWPPEIPNPLGADASHATHQALYDLNADLKGIRFHSKEACRTLYWLPTRKAESRPSLPR